MEMIPDQIKKVVPTCRYGHGPMAKIGLFSSEENFTRGLFIPTFKETPGLGTVLPDGKGYTVTTYLCSTCGYLELFDDGVTNGR